MSSTSRDPNDQRVDDDSLTIPFARVLVVVPCLNEEETIVGVVERARSVLGADVLVVDDGSIDKTASLARGAGAAVVSHPFNLGVGAAIRTSMRYAQERRYEYVLQVDGDGQHDPVNGRELLAPVVSGEVDLTVGSRFAAGYRVSRGRRMVMRRLARTVSRRLGTAITDTTSGFRAFGPRSVALFARAYPSAYLSDTVEALLIAGDAQLRVREVAVPMYERQGGTPSANLVKSAFHLVRLLLVISLHRVRRPLRERPAG